MAPYLGEHGSLKSQGEDGWLLSGESPLPYGEDDESEAVRRHLPGKDGRHLQSVPMEPLPQSLLCGPQHRRMQQPKSIIRPDAFVSAFTADESW